MAKHRLQIIGHRGAKGLGAENSIDSIRRAINAGVDAIELDVRVHTGKLVLSHDPTYRTGSYCSLSEALKEIHGKVPLNLEIKESRVVEYLPKALKNYDGEVIYSSLKFSVLQAIKEAMPDAQLAIVENWSSVRAVAVAALLGTKRIHLKQNWLWSKVVRSLAHQGYEVYAYTVNDPDRAQELFEWGITGIFTDYPNKF